MYTLKFLAERCFALTIKIEQQILFIVSTTVYVNIGDLL